MLIQDRKELKKIIDSAKKKGQTVLIKRGVFDIIHPGHTYTIEKLKEKADILIMFTVSDVLTRKKKGETRPINKQNQRSKVLCALKGVDYVYEDDSVNREEYIELLTFLEPTHLAVTLDDEQKRQAYTNPKWELLEIEDKQWPDFSTTKIIEKVLDNYKT